jgi:fatty acid desaturase
MAWVFLCVLTGLVCVQLGIVSHDAGHGQVDRRKLWNSLWGYFGMTFVCGLSFTHWRKMHGAHHRHPQDERHDPDMQYGLLFSVHERGASAKRGLWRLTQRFQHWYFWPAGCFYAWSLRWDSIARIIKDPAHTAVDRWVLLGHFALWLSFPPLLVGTKGALATYFLVSTVISLYLVAIFAPNHMGMPSVGEGDKLSYLAHQTTTSRDVQGGWLLSLFMGGLEHQIEHHLFPRIAQPRLKVARTIVSAFCAEHGFPYVEVRLLAAHRDALRHLAQVASPSRHSSKDDAEGHFGDVGLARPVTKERR